MNTQPHRLIDRRNITASVFVLRFERLGLDFKPGQFINVGRSGTSDRREYSVYSGSQDDYLEILVKEVVSGHVSPQLQQLQVGNCAEIRTPAGEFLIDGKKRNQDSHTFICTGTGISPFHCFARSYPDLSYRIIHGVRLAEERYDHQDYPADSYVSCLSQESTGDFHGRVTDYLKAHPPEPRGRFYLCGNADMIFEVFDLLRHRGVKREQVFTEVYF